MFCSLEYSKNLEKTCQWEVENKCDAVLNMNVHILLNDNFDRKKKSALGGLSFRFKDYSGDF